MAHKIFLSYAIGRDDSWLAGEIAKDLKEKNAEVFLDSIHISSGEIIEEKIQKNLRDCNELWVLITPTAMPIPVNQEIVAVQYGSIDRPYVWLEIGTAWFRNIPIIPIFPNESVMREIKPEDIPLLIRGRKRVVMYNNNNNNKTVDYKKMLDEVELKVRMKRKSERIPIQYPKEVKYCNGSKRGTGHLMEFSQDGCGCYLTTKNTLYKNESMKISMSFDAEIKHKKRKTLEGTEYRGAGMKICNSLMILKP